MEYKNFPQIKTWSKQAQIGAIHIVRTHQGGGGGVSPNRTLLIKSTIFPIQNACCGGGGVGGIFDFVHTYYVNDPIE